MVVCKVFDLFDVAQVRKQHQIGRRPYFRAEKQTRFSMIVFAWRRVSVFLREPTRACLCAEFTHISAESVFLCEIRSFSS